MNMSFEISDYSCLCFLESGQMWLLRNTARVLYKLSSSANLLAVTECNF